MALLTLTQAAKAAGIARTTLYRAIRKGRLSVVLQQNGRKLVDSDELIRAFGPLQNTTEQVQQSSIQKDVTTLYKRIDSIENKFIHIFGLLQDATNQAQQSSIYQEITTLRTRINSLEKKDSEIHNEPATKLCTHCDSLISQNATTCPHCQKLQSNWKQSMMYWAGVIGLFSGVLALSLIAIKFFGDLITKVTVGDKLSVVSFRTQGDGMFVNEGYRDIALLSVKVSVEDLGFSATFPVSTVIPKGKIKNAEIGDVIIEDYGITNGGKKEWDDLMDKKPGFFPGAMLSQDPEYLHVKEVLGPRLTTYQCQIELIILPAGDKQNTIDKKHECVGLILYDKSIMKKKDYENQYKEKAPIMRSVTLLPMLPAKTPKY